MARETYAEAQIPANGAADVPYSDQRAITRSLMGHVSECYIGEVLGAGGAGGTLVNVPFEPAYVRVINADGAVPAVTEAVFSTNPAHVTVILAAALQATPVAKAQVGANDWTLTLPTALAPNGETVVVVAFGVRDTDGGL